MMPLDITSVAASGSAPADYQREYEAMREWAYPHQHYWEYSPKRGGYVCTGCWQVKPDWSDPPNFITPDWLAKDPR